MGNAVRRPRLLIVAGSGRWAGGEHVILSVVTALGEKYDMSVVCPEPGELSEVLHALGLRAHLVRTQHWLGPIALGQLVRIMRTEGTELVYAHGARSNFYSRIAARLAGVPVFVSAVHCSLYGYPVSPLLRRIYVAVDRATARWADLVMAVSNALRDELVNRSGIPSEKVVVVPNGIDAELCKPRQPESRLFEELGLVGASPILGIIGRIAEEKGHRHLIRAMKHIAGTYPGAKLLVVGEGPLRREVERLTREMALACHVLFLGKREDVADLLSILDLVVLPSESEGLPLVVLEAMAAGKPVVAAAVGGVPELVRDGMDGLLVPPGDSAALGTAVIELLGDRDGMERMGRAGRERVVREFSLERMISAIEAQFTTLLRESRAGAPRTGS